MPLSDYLASKYLNAEPSAPAKKRKRSKRSDLIIADDDALGWTNTTPNDDDDDDGHPVITSTPSADFRKAKKNAWKIVGTAPPTDAEQAHADAIIAAASAENAAAAHEDDAPTILDDGIARMESGAHAGLQSAAAVTRQFEAQKQRDLAQFHAEQRAGTVRAKNETETVYRDATGRRVDIRMRKAEQRQEADRAAAEERAQADAQRGAVQAQERERRRAELDAARFLPVARAADDEGLNQELKARRRWNDPAARFLVEAQGAGAAAAAGGGAGKRRYAGSAMPNRYGIRPGFRWDGVDRGNGWEGERFKALNRRTRNKELDFAWQMDT